MFSTKEVIQYFITKTRKQSIYTINFRNRSNSFGEKTVCPENKIGSECVKNLKVFSKIRMRKSKGCYSNPYDAPDTEDVCWRQPDPYARAFRLGETPLSRAFFCTKECGLSKNTCCEEIQRKIWNGNWCSTISSNREFHVKKHLMILTVICVNHKD